MRASPGTIALAEDLARWHDRADPSCRVVVCSTYRHNGHYGHAAWLSSSRRGQAHESNEKRKETASQTSVGSHPARAPEGKTSRKIGVEIITTPYTVARQPPPLQAGRE